MHGTRRARRADQAADRRVVDDGAASLLAHLAELVLHAVPDAAEIDPLHALEFFAADIRGLDGRRLHARIIERRIKAAEGGDRLLDHCGYLGLVSDIGGHGDRLAAARESSSAAARTAFTLSSASADRSACLREGLGRRRDRSQARQ